MTATGSIRQSTSIAIEEIAPGGEAEWDRFVLASEHGTFFHLSGWKRVVEEVLGHRCHYFLAREGTSIRGVFPISRIRNFLFGDCLVSLPLTVYGGVCADDGASFRALVDAGTEMGRRLGVRYMEMRNRNEPYPSDLPSRDLYVTFTLNLSPGPDALMKQLPRDTRYAIRKSLKAGLEWTEGVSVDEFYDIFAENVHNLGTPVFSKRLFVVLKEQFPESCRIFGVRKAGRLIASVLCFYFRDQVLPYYAGANSEFFADAPNNFMYWKLICQSHEEGVRVFDFGRSKKGTGSFQFKSSWSMDVTPLPYRYQLIRGKEVPKLSPVDEKFKLAVRLWKQLPLGVTKLIGPGLIRWVPSV